MDDLQYQTTCPYCEVKQDLLTRVTDNTHNVPNDGDYNICFRCGDASIFDSEVPGNCRVPTDAEQEEIAQNKYVQQAIKLIKKVKESSG